jgi:hypothetical protein
MDVADHTYEKALKAGMGPLELASYRRLWRESTRFLDSRGKSDLDASRRLRHASASGHRPSGFGEEAEAPPQRRKRKMPADSARVATDLLMSRIFDERPELLAQILAGAPTVLLDAADPRTLDRVWHAWREVLFDDGRQIYVAHDGFKRTEDTDILHMTIREQPKGIAVA